MRQLRWVGWAALLFIAAPAGAAVNIRVDPAAPGLVFDGIGATSAGSSRLLIDYPEPQRSQILDYLFRPNYGASLQQLKIEIGGDGNSNAVAGPSHWRGGSDRDMNRGFEWWLASEAKKRNPAIRLSALVWNWPSWVKAAPSDAAVSYLVDYVEGMRDAHGLIIDDIGIWNETGMPRDFIPRLSRALRAKGLKTQVSADDSVNNWGLTDAMARDPELRGAVDHITTHYVEGTSSAKARERSLAWHKPLWSSEDGTWDDRWGAWGVLSHSYAEVLNQNYIGGRVTLSSIWSPLTAYPDNLGILRSGLLRAQTPWSGHYALLSPVWVIAQTTQFTRPGWRYVDSASANIQPRGSYVTLTDGHDWSVIVETMRAAKGNDIAIETAGRASGAPVQVWRTSAGDWFRKVATLRPREGHSVRFHLDPDAVYTFTTLTSGHKGDARPPADRPFPLPFADGFERYRLKDTNTRFLMAQNGGFSVERCPARAGQCLVQVVTHPPIAWGSWGTSTEAGTPALIGDPAWRDYRVSADVRPEGTGYAMLLGRTYQNDCYGPLYAYQFRLYQDGRWELHRRAKDGLLAKGRVARAPGQWSHMELVLDGDTIRGLIDGRKAFAIADRFLPTGLAGLGAGWNRAAFDNFRIAPLGSRRAVIASPSAPPNSSPLLPLWIKEPVVEGTRVSIHWDRVQYATGYRLIVRRGHDEKGPEVRSQSLGDVDHVTVDGLEPNSDYSLKVVPFNAYGDSPAPMTQPATTGPAT